MAEPRRDDYALIGESPPTVAYNRALLRGRVVDTF